MLLIPAPRDVSMSESFLNGSLVQRILNKGSLFSIAIALIAGIFWLVKIIVSDFSGQVQQVKADTIQILQQHESMQQSIKQNLEVQTRATIRSCQIIAKAYDQNPGNCNPDRDVLPSNP